MRDDDSSLCMTIAIRATRVVQAGAVRPLQLVVNPLGLSCVRMSRSRATNLMKARPGASQRVGLIERRGHPLSAMN